MAVDKAGIASLIKQLDDITKNLPGPEPAKAWVRDKLVSKALKELREYTDDARPPVFFLLGRSGAGKSSLIDALAQKEIAEVSDVRPGQKKAERHEVKVHNDESWVVVDSRGLFDPDRSNGSSPGKDKKSKDDGKQFKDAREQLKADLKEHQPDIVLHVVPAGDLRNAGDELKVVRDVLNKLPVRPATVLVLSKSDTLGRPRDWPIENFPEKLAAIEDVVTYACELIGGRATPLDTDLGSLVHGANLEGNEYMAVIPVAVDPGNWGNEGDHWNLSTLGDHVVNNLPTNALLGFAQGVRMKRHMRRIAESQVRTFSSVAGGIGAAPMPIADAFILLPLQAAMVAVVAGLSCRRPEWKEVKEYAAAVGGVALAGLVLREAARAIAQLIPGFGPPLSAAIAAAGTYAMGRSAIAYYFDNETVKPKAFEGEGMTFAEEHKFSKEPIKS